jgi:hypothetical protein
MAIFSGPIEALFVFLSALGLVRSAPVVSSTDVAPPGVYIPPGYHAWPISDAEKEHLSKMLDVDFQSLGIEGTIVNHPKEQCEGCGKYSGFEDFVHGVSCELLEQCSSSTTYE